MNAAVYMGLALAIMAGNWLVYRQGAQSGRDEVRAEWTRESATRALRTAEQQIEHRNTERALIDNAARQQRTRNETDKRIAAEHAAELDSLRNRPQQRAADRPGEAASPAADGVGCTGAGLARGDAEFLSRYAADAAKLKAEFERCTSNYDAAERALKWHGVTTVRAWPADAHPVVKP